MADAQTKQKFAQLCKLKFRDQAVWFLNGFWGDGVNGEVANGVWDYVKKFVELGLLGQERKGEEGCELDQFWSAKYLEDMDSAMPAIARKEAFRTIDQDSNGKMSTIEYLIWKYKKGVKDTVDAPQGDNTEAIKKAQQALDAATTQLADCETKLEAQKKAKQQNDKAKEDLHAAEKELEVAISELKKQEAEYNNKVATLEATSKDSSASVIQRNKAANELAQLKAEDPLPLRKAKITQEAALRKVQKQKKDAEETGRQLEKAINELEAAYVKLEQKVAEAQAELEKIKSRPGGGKGAIWWLQRELYELDGRLPKAKQKFDHAKPFNYNL